MSDRPNHRPPKERHINKEELEKEFFSIDEVGALLGFHNQTIYKMVRSGELPAKKYGNTWRIRRTELERFTDPIR